MHGPRWGMRGGWGRGMRGMHHHHHMMDREAGGPGLPPGFEHKFAGVERKFDKFEHKWGHKHGHKHGHKRDEEDESFTKDKLTARHVKDVTIPDGTKLAPKTAFVKTWRVRNEGLEWPAGSRLIFISKKGDHMEGPEFVPVEGPVLPNTEIDISVNLVAPEEPGLYTGVWRMCTAEGKKFGQRLWVSVTVTSSSSSDEFEHIGNISDLDSLVQKIQDMGFEVPRRKVERLMAKFGGNPDMVVEVLARKAMWGHGPFGHHGFGGRGGFEGRGGFDLGGFGFGGRGGF